ncbi:MAG: ABC transporter permease, partial [Candidatus Angelobacter sp.]
MNTPNIAMPGTSRSSQESVPTTIPFSRSFYWSVRREFWENRLIYIAPLGAAAIFLVSFVINTILLRFRMHGVWPVDAARQHDALTLPLALPHELSAALIMGIAMVVGIFYSLDALYGERRDRSILFWKSMPVSDLTTVLSKMAIPLVII